ncbi:cell division protein ZapE [Fretibacter rubidus]|uniref:cell division protein ZapE n=1 Tax=Fretibacter rubidus TaxID=570162 RepID=UPI00352B6F04
MSVFQKLQAKIKSGDLYEDDAQLSAARALDDVLSRLSDDPPSQNFFTRRWSAPKGLYMWGGVGRGKSMLMDWFYEEAPIEHKSRVHFHGFMLDVHARINAWRKDDSKDGDPIVPVARGIADASTLLCFDEFHVTDITDAMILSRLFEALWSRGVVVVATSNRAPDDLYKHGLNRPLFEPFIDMMPDHMIIHEFAGETDHRLRQLTAAPVYYTPLDAAARDGIDAAWARLTSGACERPTVLTVNARDVVLNRTAAGVVRTSFHRLCADTLGAADYLDLAHAFQTLILEDVPQMGPENRNEAKRFVTLIDALYETRTKLIMSAAVEPAALYQDGDGSFEFERTVSRLIEMRSEDYLAQASVMGEDEP